MNAGSELVIAVPAALAAAAAFGLAAAVQHRQAQQMPTTQAPGQRAPGQRAAGKPGPRRQAATERVMGRSTVSARAGARLLGAGAQAVPARAGARLRAMPARGAARLRAMRARAGVFGLLVRLARQPLWLAGIGLSVLAYGLQAAALAFGPLTLVAPIVATDLMLALPVAARWSGRRLSGRDWAGCALTAGGVAAFLVTAPEASGRSDAAARDWLLAFGAVALACAAATIIGRRFQRTAHRQATHDRVASHGAAAQPAAPDRALPHGAAAQGAEPYPAARAVSTAVAAGLIYGLTAAVTLSMTRLVRAEGLWTALAHWQPWALAGLGLSGLALTMGAFQAGALGASLPVIDTVEPVAGVLIGTVVFGEHLAAGLAGLAVQAAGAVVAVAGIVLLGSSPRPDRMHAPVGRLRAGDWRRNRTGRKNTTATRVTLATGGGHSGPAAASTVVTGRGGAGESDGRRA